LLSWVWYPLYWARCMHGPAAAFNVYKCCAPPITQPSSSSICSQPLPRSAAYCFTMCSLSFLSRPAQNPWSALPQLNASRRQSVWSQSSRSLALESMLLSVCDGDYSSWASWIGRDTSIDPAYLPPRRRTSTTHVAIMLQTDPAGRVVGLRVPAPWVGSATFLGPRGSGIKCLWVPDLEMGTQ
jgi:hypothetical protein